MVPASGAKVASTTPVVEHSLVINQIDKRVSETLSVIEHGTFLRRYKDKFGPRERPPIEREPSAEQLSALNVVIKSGQVPLYRFRSLGPAWRPSLPQ